MTGSCIHIHSICSATVLGKGARRGRRPRRPCRNASYSLQSGIGREKSSDPAPLRHRLAKRARPEPWRALRCIFAIVCSGNRSMATGAWHSWSRATLSICILNVWALSLRRLPARAACACTVAAGDCSRSHQSTRHSLPDLPAKQPRRCGSRFAGSLSRHWLP